MTRVIDFPSRNGKPPDNVISNGPMRLRWGDWSTTRIIQVHVHPAAAHEFQREEDLAQGRPLGGSMPAHFALDGPLHDTALAYLRFKDDGGAQQDITYLSELMEILTNVPCAILRTALIRRVYQEVESLSARLMQRWHSRSGHFLLPLNSDAGRTDHLAQKMNAVDNLQTFFSLVQQDANRRHHELANSYVLYYPRPGGIPGR